MFDNLNQSDINEESFDESEDETISNLKGMEEIKAIEYEKQIIDDYNNSNDKWNLLNEKILVVTNNNDGQKNDMRQKLYIQDLSHLSNLHRRLCRILMLIEKNLYLILTSNKDNNNQKYLAIFLINL